MSRYKQFHYKGQPPSQGEKCPFEGGTPSIQLRLKYNPKCIWINDDKGQPVALLRFKNDKLVLNLIGQDKQGLSISTQEFVLDKGI